MTDKEKKLAADLLKLAAEEFGNHGCNDIDDKLFEGWTDEEKTSLCRDYEMVNSEGRDYEEGDVITEDWIAMYAMAYKLEGTKH
jgi:hypothetical protein